MKGTILILGVILVLTGLVGAESAQAQQLCIRSARANLRSGPGKEFRITWEVNRYMPLIQIDKKGNWVKVKDVDGDIHWVFGSLVDGKLDCITIKNKVANIRKKPSAKAEKWFTVQKYTSFRRIGQKSKWIKIKYEGQVMWVFHSLVWPSSS